MNDIMTKSWRSYVDLKKETIKDLEAGLDSDIEMSNMDQGLTTFLAKAEIVTTEINSVRDLMNQLQHSSEESKSLLKPQALRAIRNKMNSNVMLVLKMSRSIKAQLEDMDRSNAANRRLSGCKEGTAVDRTRSAVTNGLRKKLKELMMEFQVLRQRMMTEYEDAVGRKYYTVTGEYPDEDMIEKIISDHNGGEKVMAKAIQEHGRGKVLETVAEIQDRHDAAKEMETSLLELHHVFLEMAVIVEAQGEQMDDIEHHVMNAAQYVSDGFKNLKTAKMYQKRSRRCVCIGLVLLLILILVIVIPIATSFSKS
ncbi:Syntaxin-related protein KNOLLE [Heracleum sosnowskyi]|uniref:Syntaxin-related protein KNOLLE n=1 Tax=Heracleum sosnowskyi TaxID=360622 RepID=A0AAD8GRP9_9APIA|nr:Syntaxin-related protein KNOLLE [Heracleum sosnowskyi]